MSSHSCTVLICIGLPFLCSCGSNDISKQRDLSKTHPAAAHLEVGPHGGDLQHLGDRHLELLFDKKNSVISVNVLDREARTPAPIATESLTAIVSLQAHEFTEIKLEAVTNPQEPQGKHSSFSGTVSASPLPKVFSIVIRLALDNVQYRARFHVNTEATVDKFVCPMGCEGTKSYPSPGQCAICKMALVSYRAAHSDHAPKHGGTFFMAPNGWHHIEGTSPSVREFRVYVYNNFTRPISTNGLPDGSTVDGEISDSNGKMSKEFAGIPLRPSENGAYLIAELPEYASFPMKLTAHIKFKANESPALFNFNFSEVTKQD